MTNTASPPEKLADEEPAGPAETRARLLRDSRRTMVPIRHAAIQRPRSTGRERGAKLAELVRGRQTRALDAWLLLLALEPVLEGTPLPSTVWARALSPDAGPSISAAGLSKTWGVLEAAGLAERGTRINRRANVMPLREDGSGKTYSRPGLDPRGTSTGYFWLPIRYWLDAWHRELSLPAKATLLIWLSATSQQLYFAMSYEQAPNWYGISERTAERGVRELERLGLMTSLGQKVADARSPLGHTIRYHRSLTGAFSLISRQAAHAAMVKQAAARKKKQNPLRDTPEAGEQEIA
jgi:hypothetical protein